MSEIEIIRLLDKYLAGDCTVEEKNRVEEWINNVNRKENEWAAMSEHERHQYLKAIYKNLKERIRETSNLPETSNIGHKHPHRFPFILAAASFLVLIGVGGVLSGIIPIKRSQSQKNYISISTPAGTIKEITLADSTHVWLNAMSILRFPQKFNSKNREAYLSGEAFFEIAPHPDKPFIIHTQHTQTKILGTSLNVNAYPSESNIQVTVVSGKVEVSAVNNKVILDANQAAVYSKTGNRLSKENVTDASDYILWRSGKLAFHHTPLSEVVRSLQRVYDMKFIIENPSVSNYQLSGYFDVHQSVKMTVRAICLSVGANYSIKDDTVTITGQSIK